MNARRVCVNPPLNARGTIAAAAEAYGWIRDPKQSWSLEDFYRKGCRYVRVYFSLRGAVVSGALQRADGSGWYLQGKGRREQVVAFMTE